MFSEKFRSRESEKTIFILLKEFITSRKKLCGLFYGINGARIVLEFCYLSNTCHSTYKNTIKINLSSLKLINSFLCIKYVY